MSDRWIFIPPAEWNTGASIQEVAFGGRSERWEAPAACQGAAGGEEGANGGERHHTQRHRETLGCCVESGDTGMMEAKAQLLNHEKQITEEKTFSQ